MIPGQSFNSGRLGGDTDMWVSMIDVSLERVVRRVMQLRNAGVGSGLD